MLEKLKDIGENISGIICATMFAGIVLIFSGMIIVGFITLCLGAL